MQGSKEPWIRERTKVRRGPEITQDFKLQQDLEGEVQYLSISTISWGGAGIVREMGAVVPGQTSGR